MFCLDIVNFQEMLSVEWSITDISEEWQGIILSWYFSLNDPLQLLDWLNQRKTSQEFFSWNPLRMDGEFERGKSAVLRKLGRTETGYFSRRSQSLPTVLPTNWTLGQRGRSEISQATSGPDWKSLILIVEHLNISKNQNHIQRIFSEEHLIGLSCRVQLYLMVDHG